MNSLFDLLFCIFADHLENMKTVDTKGQLCPAPIIATKKMLQEASKGETFKVLTDNRTSLNNLSRFLKDNKTDFSVDEKDGVWTLLVTKPLSEEVYSKAEDYCITEIPHLNQGDFVVAFSSERMGEGDDQLGSMLIMNFIKAIKDMDMLPSKMVFYNSGVKLGSVDSDAFIHLKEIEKMGVQLLLCGTCAKHFDLEEKINVGSLSNMYEIAQVMASAGNIIKP
jgi:selenium metabolism protein YedF